MSGLRLDRWADGWEQVLPGVRRRVASGRLMTVTFYQFEPGGRFPLHAHAQEQAVLVIRGALTFSAASAQETAVPDTVLWIPPDLPHDAVAGPKGAWVVSIVSPARRSNHDVRILES
ncbi:MAG: cupin domain-containing protein [Armatimonadota bacterium]|nr:cupin domain-containing protein [Armatimonadota bacterium]MDR5698061.1 cupin domain-containing protein [Armatimonadota bacterium]